MKLIGWMLAVIVILGVSCFDANAGVTCSTDYFGNTTCRGNGADSGWSSRGSKDYFGNETWRDNSGNTTTCHTDYFGNYVCN